MIIAILKLMSGRNSRGRRMRANTPSIIITAIRILAATGLLTEIFARFIVNNYYAV
jgi:hypothetical protein